MDGMRPLLLSANPTADLNSRFSDHQLQYEERNQHLVALTQTYLATMADLGVETWVMHGTLLGWWWNQKVSRNSAFQTALSLICDRYYPGTPISMSK